MVGYVRLLFSFSGRVGRIVFAGIMALIIMAFAAIFFIVDAASMASGRNAFVVAIRNIVLMIAIVAFVVSMVSVHVRRMHDQGLSGLNAIPGLAMLCGGLLAFLIVEFVEVLYRVVFGKIEIHFGVWLGLLTLRVTGAILLLIYLVPFGIRRGTQGPNQYGPEPLDDDEPLPVFPIRD